MSVLVFAKVPTPQFSVLVDAKNNHDMAVKEHHQPKVLCQYLWLLFMGFLTSSST